MNRRRRFEPSAVLCAALLLIVTTSCRQPSSAQPTGSGAAETQPGSSADQSRGPRQGAASADCRSLPSAADLKKWLRETPSESEAGGLFSGKMEWAAVVDRRGRLCATAVATDDPS